MIEVTREFNQKRPISQSSGKEFLRSPMHYVSYLEKPFTSSPALILGNLVDCLLLEPERYEKRYVISPKFDRRTKVGKEGYDEFLKENTDKQWIDQEQLDTASMMVQSIKTHEPAMRLLEGVVAIQERLEWTDKATDLKCVTIYDARNEDTMISLKTSRDADPDSFYTDAFNFGYFLQVGFELEGLKVKKFEFPIYKYIIVESCAPYCVNVSKASEDFVEYGKNKYRELMSKFNYCLEKGLFKQGYEFKSLSPLTGEHTLDLPPWAKRKVNEY